MRRPPRLFHMLLAVCLMSIGFLNASAQTALTSIRGTVADQAGALLPNATVRLVTRDVTQTVVSGADGDFSFQKVSAGPYTLTITAAGLQPLTTSGTVNPGESITLQTLTLRVASVATEVTAISQREAAELQIQDEEHQRLLGVLPNFFVVYGGHPVPLDTRQKFKLSFRTLVDPAIFVTSGINAGIEQGVNAYPEFGSGFGGFATRYAASYGNAFTGILLSGAIFPTIFHQDPRYFVKGEGSKKSRVLYALTRAVAQPGDNGKLQPGYSNLLGNVGSALISTAYYPHGNINWSATAAENFGIGIGGEALGNLLEEFVFNHLTTKAKRDKK